jgi:hypothetical protein
MLQDNVVNFINFYLHRYFHKIFIQFSFITVQAFFFLPQHPLVDFFHPCIIDNFNFLNTYVLHLTSNFSTLVRMLAYELILTSIKAGILRGCIRESSSQPIACFALHFYPIACRLIEDAC